MAAKPFWPHQSTEAGTHLASILFLIAENGDSETDEISLLSAQSAHLSAARVRHSAGLQCRLRKTQLHPAIVRLSVKVSC